MVTQGKNLEISGSDKMKEWTCPKDKLGIKTKIRDRGLVEDLFNGDRV